MACQVAFDLCEGQNQSFLNRVCGYLPKSLEEKASDNDKSASDDSNNNNNNDNNNDNNSNNNDNNNDDNNDNNDNNDKDKAKPAKDIGTPAKSKSELYYGKLKKLKLILTGATSIRLYLHFLFQHNKTDLNILNAIKVCVCVCVCVCTYVCMYVCVYVCMYV